MYGWERGACVCVPCTVGFDRRLYTYTHKHHNRHLDCFWCVCFSKHCTVVGDGGGGGDGDALGKILFHSAAVCLYTEFVSSFMYIVYLYITARFTSYIIIIIIMYVIYKIFERI